MFLLQCFHESGFKTISMLSLKCLLNVASNALFANDLRIFSNWTVLKSWISSFTLFFPLPDWGEVDFALGAAVWLLWETWLFVLGKIVDNVLQSQKIHEFRIAGIRDEVHLRWWRFGRWDL